MADPKFRTEIVADPTPYKAGMDQASRIAQETAQSMAKVFQQQFSSIQGTMQGMVSNMTGMFTKMQGLIAGIGTALTGSSAANTTKEVTVEATKMARALGISTTEASILNVALGDIYQTSDTLLAANRAMTKELRTNEQSFRQLGVATRESGGGFRNSLDIMLDVNKVLATFREGTDRNIEGQKIYKKAWEEVAPVIKLTADVMESSRAKAEALNLVVGAESVEMVTKYRATMNDVGDVLKGIGKAVGDVLMPVLTDMGEWFASTGPERVEIMRKATAVLVAGFYSAQTVILVVWESIKAFVATAAVLLLKFAETLGFALKGDFAGAKAAWQRGTDQQVDIWKNAFDRIRKITEENREKTAQAFARGFDAPKVTPTQRATGGRGSAGGEDKNAMAKWEAELRAQRDAYDRRKLEEGSFETYTLEMEAAFWKKKMDLAGGNEKLRAAAATKYYDVERQLRKNAFDAQVADLQQQMAMAETSAEEKIALANKVYQLEVQRHKAGSKEAIAALKEVQKAYDEWAKQQREIRDLQLAAEKSYQLSRVELERNHLDTIESLGLIKADEKVKRLRDLKEIEYAIELKALEDKQELMAQDKTTDPVKYQELLNQIRALKEKHVVDMAKLDDQLLIEQKKLSDQWFDPLGNGFQKFVDGVIQGTRKWTDVFKQAILSVGQEYIAMLVKMGLEWAKAQIFQKMASTATGAVGAASQSAAAAAQTAAQAPLVAALSTVTGAVTGSGTATGLLTTTLNTTIFTAITTLTLALGTLEAAVIANTAAIATQAPGNAAEGLGGILQVASFMAPGGFDVPAGIKPITQLHPKEMVLPAHIADPLRDMIAGGGGADSATAPTIALQAVSLGGDFWMVNQKNLAKAVEAAYRNGYRPRKR